MLNGGLSTDIVYNILLLVDNMDELIVSSCIVVKFRGYGHMIVVPV